MKILWNNTATSSSVTSMTEDNDYPIENIQDIRTKKVYRSDSFDSSNDARIVFDGSATASYCVLVNHNLTSTATITLEGNDSNAWSSPSFSESMTYNSGMIVHSFTENTYNYWSLFIEDSANTDGYFELGFVFLGTYLQMPKMKRDQSLPQNIDTNQQIGKGGQVFGSLNYNYRSFGVNFNFLTNTQRQNINTMFKSVGNTTPVIMLPWTDRDFEDYLYCIIDQTTLDFKRTNSQNLPFSLTMKFREVY